MGTYVYTPEIALSEGFTQHPHKILLFVVSINFLEKLINTKVKTNFPKHRLFKYFKID